MGNFLQYLIYTPQSDFRYVWPLIILFALSIIGAVISSQFIKKKDALTRKKIQSYPELIIWISIVGIFLVFARSQSIPIFSSRILLIIALMLYTYCVSYPLYILKQEVPEIKVYMKQQKERDKYLPRKKKFKKSKKR